jgi:hypothetical protein
MQAARTYLLERSARDEIPIPQCAERLAQRLLIRRPVGVHELPPLRYAHGRRAWPSEVYIPQVAHDHIGPMLA